MSDKSEGRLAELEAEVGRLRAEVTTSQANFKQALSRATRLAQLVDALNHLIDPREILDRAAREVADLFLADIAVFLVSTRDSGIELAAQWGLPAPSTPDEVTDLPVGVQTLTATNPLVAGSVDELEPPRWLRPAQPQHIVWGRLAARDENLGYLVLVRRGTQPFGTADLQELGLVVSRVSLAVDNGRLYSRTQQQLRRLQRLHEVTAMLAGTLDLDRVVEALASTVVREVPAVGAAVYLDRERGLQLAGQAGDTGDIPLWINAGAPIRRADVRLLPLGVGGPGPGTMLLVGGPPPGSEPNSFLQHLADLGSLVIDKALVFERTRSLAESDTLTGLPNRALLMDRLHSALARCQRTNSDLAVIFVDLDDFKSVNDTYGHATGDALLVAVAARLLNAVRPADTVSRVGGDEFVLICRDIGGMEAAAMVGARVRTALAGPYQFDDVRLWTRGSVGVGLASACGYKPVALLHHADQNMYADKHRHRTHARPIPQPHRAARVLSGSWAPGPGGPE